MHQANGEQHKHRCPGAQSEGWLAHGGVIREKVYTEKSILKGTTHVTHTAHCTERMENETGG